STFIFFYRCPPLPSLLSCSFFFSSRRRHTRFSRDWSSDVCSSDLSHELRGRALHGALRAKREGPGVARRRQPREHDRDPRGARRSEERRVGKERRTWWSAYE